MPAARSILLFQQVAPIDATHGHWWLAECYATSDGPRMRLLAPHPTEEAARQEMERRETLLAQPDQRDYQRGYRDGQNDGLSRARNRPGDGDMGG